MTLEKQWGSEGKEICFKLAMELRRQGYRRRGGINQSPHVPMESAGVLGETI